MAETDRFEKESLSFVCEKCGECCRHIEAFVGSLPYQENGVCGYLKGDLCSIYEKRPDFCDFKRAYGYFKDSMTEAEYLEKTRCFCELLKCLKKKRT
ncbi:MAG: hypothetical protein LBD13_06275 [Spirochaetaceae bacterium]|nr:hypothetical protein [Spirochaetaceae bacterium]